MAGGYWFKFWLSFLALMDFYSETYIFNLDQRYGDNMCGISHMRGWISLLNLIIAVNFTPQGPGPKKKQSKCHTHFSCWWFHSLQILITLLYVQVFIHLISLFGSFMDVFTDFCLGFEHKKRLFKAAIMTCSPLNQSITIDLDLNTAVISLSLLCRLRALMMSPAHDDSSCIWHLLSSAGGSRDTSFRYKTQTKPLYPFKL